MNYEVFKRVLQEFGEELALDAMGIMSLGTIIDLDRQIVVHATQISTDLKLAMADSIILAATHAHAATLWSQDVHFKGLEVVRYKEKKSKKQNLSVCTINSRNYLKKAVPFFSLYGVATIAWNMPNPNRLSIRLFRPAALTSSNGF